MLKPIALVLVASLIWCCAVSNTPITVESACLVESMGISILTCARQPTAETTGQTKQRHENAHRLHLPESGALCAVCQWRPCHGVDDRSLTANGELAKPGLVHCSSLSSSDNLVSHSSRSIDTSAHINTQQRRGSWVPNDWCAAASLSHMKAAPIRRRVVDPFSNLRGR